jgi:ribosomal protein S18 acetylase RimI-like enzyme
MGSVADRLSIRPPSEADHAAIVRRVDEWSGGRRVRQTLPRLWFQHFTGTSLIAEVDGRLTGFLVGFVSPDHPHEAYVHLVAVDPNLRRRGVARAMYERFFELTAARGARRVRAVTWPGDRGAIGFHRAMGFRPEEGPGSQRIYGTPAYPDYDDDGEDRVVLVRDLPAR